MPRPPDRAVYDAVFTVAASPAYATNTPPFTTVKASKVTSALADLGIEVSDRNVQRILSKYADLKETQRLGYMEATWPESCEYGALPWEAGEALLRRIGALRAEEFPPPTNRHVLWYWRVCQAAPHADDVERVRAALLLEIAGAGFADDSRGLRRDVETFLAGGGPLPDIKAVVPRSRIRQFARMTSSAGMYSDHLEGDDDGASS